MNLTVIETSPTTVLTVEGEFLGVIHGPALLEAVAAMRRRGRIEVVLDLRSSTITDSAGLGVLIEAATALRSDGGDLRVAVREGRLRRLFVMTGLLGRVFSVYPTLKEAVESFGAAAVGES
jgi:anti-sigma B factor antagonist